MTPDRDLVDQPAPSGRPITGRTVLFAVVAFFTVVVGVNMIMLKLATASFSGLDTPSAFREGLAYNREAKAAEAQAARGWKVEASVTRRDDNAASVIVTVLDRDGLVIPGLDGEVRLARPANRYMDRTSALAFAGSLYEATLADAPAGQWDLVLTFERNGERMFLSRSRIMVR